jgi:hypothetical protein
MLAPRFKNRHANAHGDFLDKCASRIAIRTVPHTDNLPAS